MLGSCYRNHLGYSVQANSQVPVRDFPESSDVTDLALTNVK